jgi:hypothetical protein
MRTACDATEVRRDCYHPTKTENERKRGAEDKKKERDSDNSDPLMLLRLVRRAPRGPTVDNNRRVPAGQGGRAWGVDSEKRRGRTVVA